MDCFLLFFPVHQHRTSQSNRIAVRNQFPLAHILSRLLEHKWKRFLLFVQLNVNPSGE